MCLLFNVSIPVKMSPGKMSTSLASTADSSTFAAISSATDADDGNLTKDETNFEMSENIRKSINGTDTILVGIGNGEKNENALRGKSNEERIKQEVIDTNWKLSSIN